LPPRVSLVWQYEGARKVARGGTTLPFATPDGMNGLATFTMGALDLATGKMRTPQKTVVKTYKGEAKPENLTKTKVTTTEDDEEALKAIREGRTRLPPPPHHRAGAVQPRAVRPAAAGGRE
jgi:hypothetical protein